MLSFVPPNFLRLLPFQVPTNSDGFARESGIRIVDWRIYFTLVGVHENLEDLHHLSLWFGTDENCEIKRWLVCGLRHLRSNTLFSSFPLRLICLTAVRSISNSDSPYTVLCCRKPGGGCKPACQLAIQSFDENCRPQM